MYINKYIKNVRERLEANPAGVEGIAKQYGLSVEETEKRINDYLDSNEQAHESSFKDENAVVFWMRAVKFPAQDKKL